MPKNYIYTPGGGVKITETPKLKGVGLSGTPLDPVILRGGPQRLQLYGQSGSSAMVTTWKGHSARNLQLRWTTDWSRSLESRQEGGLGHV